MRFIASLIVAFASLAALPAAAQELPGRVGRIAYIDGSAAIYQEPEEGWERAYVNSPITSENSVWTDPDSRAELRVGGTAVRLNEATQVDIARLDDEVLDAFIARGVVAVRVRHYDRGERLVFNTPHARFVLRANGRYRIDVDPDQEESRITVFAGEARVGSEGGRVRAAAGQTVRVFGGSQPSYVVERAYADPFDRWAQTRDATWVETRSVKYVSPYMTGYEDLDRYGEWREESDFGALWFPTRIAADWAPYRYGRWDYVRPWGWTWVDDAPWGYAPFHYGRWVFVRDRWAWSPGRREVRPAWAPALVAWIGGSNFSVGVSSGPSVGWYPLSPWDRYQPWYNASTTYVNRINVTVVSDRPQRDDRRQWMERTRERGVTVVNRDAVVERRPVQQARVQVNPEVVRQAQAATVTAAQVLPSRNEVIQRRQTARTQAAGSTAAPVKQPGPAPAPTAAAAVQRGERAAPAARPDFARKPAAAAAVPEPAKTAPPPPKPVTAPTAAAQQQAREEKAQVREQAEKGRDTRAAEQQKAREEQLKQREAQQQQPQQLQQQQEQQRQEKAARGEQQRQQQQQAQERAQQEKAAREAQQNQQRQQQQGQERAQQDKAAREAQENQQRQQQQQAQERAQQEKAAREAQQVQERQQQQQARERALQEKAAREAQQVQQRQQAQQAQERAQQEKAAREAQQAQQRQQAQQAQERAQQEKAAREAQQAQQRQQRAQPQQQQQQQPPPPPAQSAKERARLEREKAKAEKDEEEEKKKGKGR